jgi:diguanylate cyclase (GGDEF)-like protein
MAKSKNKNVSVYKFTAVMLAVVCLFNTGVLSIIYTRAREINKSTTNSVKYMSIISDKLSEVNENVLFLISDMKDDDSNVLQNEKKAFEEIEKNMKLYEAEKRHSEKELEQYAKAKEAIERYKNKLQELFNSMSNFGTDNVSLYLDNVYIIEADVKTKITSTVELSIENAETLNKRNSVVHGIAQLILIIFLVVGEIAIYFAIRRAKRNEEELEERSNALDAAGKRLKMSQQKMEDIALTNILTGMKNRYALENDILPRLETDQFNIAVFDLDRFRQINDTFGYDFGDEYLASIAEQLKANFSDVAEIYNITGNEFCFIFNSNVSDSQAQRTAEGILAVMSSQYEVNRIMTQLTASGSIYHYLPNDCLNLDSLLIKMDTAVRQVKANGGNSIYKVNSL